MSEGALKVLKVPVPNSPNFAIQIKGHLVECLRFDAQIFKDSAIVMQGGQPKMKIAVFLWVLMIETDIEETHEFIMVHTGQDFPMFDGELTYIDSANVPVPAGEIEMHLFYAGMPELTDDMKEKLANARTASEQSNTNKKETRNEIIN